MPGDTGLGCPVCIGLTPLYLSSALWVPICRTPTVATAVTLAWGQLQDAQAALPVVRFLTGRFDNGCFFFSRRKRAGGPSYSHHVPTWYLPGLVDTPQASFMGRRLFSAAKRNETCLPGPV